MTRIVKGFVAHETEDRWEACGILVIAGQPYRSGAPLYRLRESWAPGWDAYQDTMGTFYLVPASAREEVA